MSKKRIARNKRHNEDADQVIELLMINTIKNLKKSKATKKALFTRCKNRIIESLASDNVDLATLKEIKETFSKTYEELLDVLSKLESKYEENNDGAQQNKTIDEMEMLNEEYDKTVNRINNILLEQRSCQSVSGKSSSSKLSRTSKRTEKSKEEIVQEKRTDIEKRYEKAREELDKEMENEIEKLSIDQQNEVR